MKIHWKENGEQAFGYIDGVLVATITKRYVIDTKVGKHYSSKFRAAKLRAEEIIRKELKAS